MPVLRRIWNPAEYQGHGVTRRYFEGWYFKQVDAAGNETVAVIPGVSYSPDGAKSHAFVQVVASGRETHYFTYPLEEFRYDTTSRFRIDVGPNAFSCERMVLELDDGVRTARGEVGFGPMTPWPVTLLSPGIMGWYRFVPRMETYHAVLSMDHGLSGWLELDGHRLDLNGGRGYAEKDWGHSFPSSWIWAQSNHFGRQATSVTLSVAKIPWMRGSFVGNIAGLLLDGELHRFATYTGAVPMRVETSDDEARVTIADKREELEIHLLGSATHLLKAPVLGEMEGRDAESLGGTIHVTLRTVRGGRGTVMFDGTGTNAAIEIMNDRGELSR